MFYSQFFAINIYLLDLIIYLSFHIENIYLDIKKTNCSHHRCCMPGCRTPRNNLTRIPMHRSIDNWDGNVLKCKNKFTPDKITEMIDLLCNVKQKNMLPEAQSGNFAYERVKLNPFYLLCQYLF